METAEAAVRVRRARTAHRRSDDGVASQQAPSGVRDQFEQGVEGNERIEARCRASSRRGAATRYQFQHGWPCAAFTLLVDARAERRWSANRNDRKEDRRDIWIIRELQNVFRKSRDQHQGKRLGDA